MLCEHAAQPHVAAAATRSNIKTINNKQRTQRPLIFGPAQKIGACPRIYARDSSPSQHDSQM